MNVDVQTKENLADYTTSYANQGSWEYFEASL